MISNGCLYPSPVKTKAVLHIPEPASTKDVQSFLGLTECMRKFINSYSIIAKALSDLLKHNVKFNFGLDEPAAFAQLKNILASEPALSIYNPHAETEILYNASIDGYDAVLQQKSITDNKFQPVYYFIKKTTYTQRRFSSYKLEVIGVIEALKIFCIYVFGIAFKIVIDFKAFKMTMEKKDLCPKILMGLPFVRIYLYSWVL